MLTSDKFVLQQPGKVTFNVTPELLRSISGKEGSDFAFAQPATIDLAINTLDIPLFEGSPVLNISIGSTPPSIQGLPMNSGLTLHDLILNVSGNPLEESQLQLSANIVPHNTDSGIGLALGSKASVAWTAKSLSMTTGL